MQRDIWKILILRLVYMKKTEIKSCYEQLVNVMKDTEKIGILLLDRKIKLRVVA